MIDSNNGEINDKGSENDFFKIVVGMLPLSQHARAHLFRALTQPYVPELSELC